MTQGIYSQLEWLKEFENQTLNINKMKKVIKLHGPNGKGVTDNKYCFSLRDLNGDLISESVLFPDEATLMGAVSIFTELLTDWEIDKTDL